MKRSAFILCLFWAIHSLPAQIVFQQFPQTLQLYPRALSTNTASVHISGKAASSPGTLVFSMAQSNGGVETKVLTISDLPAGQFDVVFEITAGLWTYQFTAKQTLGADTFLLREANQIVAGDAYAVEGQSNAQAVAYNGNANIWQSNFVRCFGDPNPANYEDTHWYLAEGNGYFSPGAVGQWALRMGYLLQEQLQIPIALINGADPGKPIEFFQRNDAMHDDSTTNYGRLLRRLNHSGLTAHLRGMLYYQGESDGDRADIHKTLFEALHSDWLEDYPSLEAFYVVQVREGCGSPSLQLRQYQKDFENYLPLTKCMTANGINGHDGCHYALPGYQTLGEKLYKQISSDLYNAPTGAQTNIRVISARFTNALNTQIALLTDASLPMTLQTGAASDFRLNGSSASVIGVQALDHEILLNLDQSVNKPGAGLSYAGHAGSDAWVLNADGYGMFTFYKLPIDDYHPLPNYDVPGIMSGPGNCVAFDGVNDQIYAGPVLGASYTKEAWINLDGVNQLNNIISGAQNTAFWAPNGVLSAGHNGAWQQVSDNVVLTPNQWTHVALSYDAAASILKLYKNGKLVSEAQNVPAHNDPEVFIGAYAGCCTFYGKIDEVRIWNTVRTIEEIRSNMCQKLQGTEAGLSAYFRLDETIGTLAPNSIGSPGQMLNFEDYGLDGAWQRSGAPIGTKSVNTYQNSGPLALSISSGDSLFLLAAAIPDFVHLYFTEELPNVLQPAEHFSVVDNGRYFGLFYPGQSIPDYTLQYHYSGNPFAFIQEENLGLLKRKNNAQSFWEEVSPNGLNLPEHIIQASGTQFQEYILAIRDSVALTPISVSMSLIQPVICNGLSDGVILASVSGGLSPYSFSLNGGPAQSSGWFDHLTPGSYTVQVTDALGNSATSDLITLQSPDPLSVSLLIAENDVNLNLSGGTPPYSFHSNAPHPDLQDLPNGNYSLTVTDAQGCSVVSSFSIQFNPLSLFTILFTNDPCDGLVEVVVVANGGMPPYQYRMNGGAFQNSNSFSNLSPGIYSFEVIDADSTVVELPNLSVSAIPVLTANAIISGDSLLVVASGGTPPYTYFLNGSAPQSNGWFANVGEGDYIVTVQDMGGCSVSLSGTIETSNAHEFIREWGINIHPNPSAGIFLLEVGQISASLKATVFSLHGIALQAFDIPASEAPISRALDLSTLPDGIYVVRLTDGRQNALVRLVKISR